MKRVIANLFVLLFLFSKSFAQANPGACQISLAHSNVSSSNDLFTLFNNPAGLAYLNLREVGFFYSPAPFDIRELSNAYAAYCEPTSIGSFGAGVSIYGYELYKETKFAFGYGKKISNNFFAGLTAVYQNTSIKNYGSKGILIFNLGAIARLNDQIGLGFVIENISRSTLANESNQIPTVLWIGTDLKLFPEISFSAAIKKEIGFNPSLRIGTEYLLINFLKLRVGVSNEPNTYSGGFGILYDFLQADYTVSSHPDLNLTHQFGLIIRFINK